LKKLATRAGTEFSFANAADSLNNDHTQWLADIADEFAPSESTVAILSMRYYTGVSMGTA
jgi:hypothetical protein